MSKTNRKDKRDRDVPRNGVLLGLILAGKGTQVMRDRRKRRCKDARHNPLREEW